MISRAERRRRSALNPSDPDYLAPDPIAWQEARRRVGWRLYVNGRLHSTIVESPAVLHALAALVTERSRDITTIANRVDDLRDAIQDSAATLADEYCPEMVQAEYERIIAEREEE
jgi:hypothetical protein